MTRALELDLFKMRKNNCCTTTSVVNMFSRCLCIKTRKVTTQPPEKEMKAIEKELFFQKRFFEEQARPQQMRKKLAFSSIPRVPLSIRAKQGSLHEADGKSVD